MAKDRTLLVKTQLKPNLIEALTTNEMIDPTKARELYSVVGLKGPTSDMEWLESVKTHTGLLNAFYEQGYALYGGKKPLQQKKRSPRRR